MLLAADVYLTSVDQLKTAFARGSYGKNLHSDGEE